jgi:chemotaxis protein methyltransferase CheR
MEILSTRPLYGSINEQELALFSGYLREKSGIVVPPETAYLFETRLSKMLADAGCDSFTEFYRYVKSGADPDIEQKIIDAMAIHETLWFRDSSPWEVFESDILPGLIEGIRSGKRLRARIWSAAVSTGQEAYSTAMCVDNYLKTHKVSGVRLSDFDFLATDISGSVLRIAEMARYDHISIRRGLDDYYRDRYFTRQDEAWELDPAIRGAVTFRRFNLMDNFAPLGVFDVIFCRYVLIYLSAELKGNIVLKLRDSLVDNGAVFVGNSAIHDYFYGRFDMRHYKNLTYYVKKPWGK